MKDKSRFRVGVLVGLMFSITLTIFTLLWFGQEFNTIDIYYFVIVLCLVLVCLAWAAIAGVKSGGN